jgi:hypothetical protein
MKQKMVKVWMAVMLAGMSCFAQKDAGVKPLQNKYGGLSLPMTVSSVSQKLKCQPSVENDEMIEMDVYTWELKSGLTVASLVSPEKGVKKANDIRFSSDNKKLKLTGLPYGLSLYGSTLKGCLSKFKAYKPQKTALYEAEPDGKLSGYKVVFKRGLLYFILLFDGELLQSMTVAAYNLEAAS